MILLGLGSNLPSQTYGPPVATLASALEALRTHGVQLVRRSCWYRSAPISERPQPWYVNAVASITTRMEPRALLTVLHRIERDFGRVRSLPNEARILDLDILDYHGQVIMEPSDLVLPHPRMHERAFVLVPLREIAPEWRHPVFGIDADDLIARLPSDQPIERLDA